MYNIELLYSTTSLPVLESGWVMLMNSFVLGGDWSHSHKPNRIPAPVYNRELLYPTASQLNATTSRLRKGGGWFKPPAPAQPPTFVRESVGLRMFLTLIFKYEYFIH